MALAAPTDPALPGFTGVYVFGDSLVDPGNALQAAQLVARFPFIGLPEGAPLASEGYFQGRFTDGYNFADLISNKMLLVATKTTFPYGFEDPLLGIDLPFVSRPTGANLSFAYGGAQAVQGNEDVPDLDDQTDAYGKFATADPNALYIVTIGGNDVRELVPEVADPAAPAAATTRLNSAASEIAGEVQELFQAGARHILVTGIPNVGLLPDYIGTTGEAQRRTLATAYSVQLDDLVAGKLAALSLPAGADLTRASLIDFANKLLADPAAYHLTNTDQARTLVQAGALDTSGTSGFLFFDEVHPSAQVHALFAASVLDSYRPAAERLDLPPQAAIALTSSIETAGDTDDFRVSLLTGRSYVFDLLGVSNAAGTLADPRLILLDGTTILASDDDSGLGLDARLGFTATLTGDFTVRAAGAGVTLGGYRLDAREANGADLLMTGRLRGSDENVTGTGGVDTIIAEAGANSLLGLAGADVLMGGSGADSMNGNQGDDLARGGGGDDTLYGGRDNDSVSGDGGADFVSGDLGDDTVNGNAGADIIAGGAGSDTLRGGQGDDFLIGDAGDDFIAGDRGADIMAGGLGADLFYAFIGSGVDRVSDFNRDEGDRVGLAVGTAYFTAQSGADVVVSFTDGQVVMANVQLTALSDGWLIYV